MTDTQTPTLPLTEATQRAQWRIETLQMVNWGGFQGPHTVHFAHDSTLMSGASGTGKSTVLDAWIALMMPSDTPFNGASNEAGGRARSAEQRNLLTYLRGKMDSVRVTGSDEMRDDVLRGADGGHIWGGLAGTFINDQGRRFTVVRLYFLRAGAVTNSDVATTYATFEGWIDLATLEPLAATRFDKRSLRGAGLQPYNTFREFEDTVHTRLGIGGGDGGRKAMRLLARVQAGMEVKRVDHLYKSMVLERPVTYDVADDALGHFADLEASYAKMLDEADKMKALSRLPALQQQLADAQQRALLIDQFGAERTGPSPFRLWSLRTERGLLDTAVEHNREQHHATVEAFEKARTTEQDLGQRLRQIAQEKRDNGGDAIDARLRTIDQLEERQQQAYQASLAFQVRTEAIGLAVPETAEEFATAQEDAAEFLDTFEERQKELKQQAEDHRQQRYPLVSQRSDLLAERSSLQGRTGMVPHRMHAARVKMAQAAGLDPMEDLPFVAELVDVLPDEEHWRKAIETTLGGIARTVLVDRDQRARLSAAIDPLRISPRIRFQAVDLQPHQDWAGDPDYVSGKLAFKDSPFSAWVQDRVSAPGTDHLCVPHAGQLDGREPRVTPAGQTRHGDRGAHGESADGNIIGFSNERRLEDIDTALADLGPRIAAIEDELAQIEARLTSLHDQHRAHTYVQDTPWERIDHLGVARQIETLKQEIARLRADSTVLNGLQAEEERLTPLLQQANRVRVLAEQRLETLTTEHSDLVDEQDQVQDAIDEIDRAQSATVTEEQQTHLDTVFASHCDTTSLGDFHRNMRALRTRLREDATQATKDARQATASMETMFEAYQQRWVEHNLGTSVASADGYREILDRITAEGLHERRDRWRREFAAWSSDDLLRLGDAYDTAVEDIEERLAPINRILSTLPFGGKGFLQIQHRRLHNEELRVFRRDLRTLSSGLAAELTDAQVESRFRQLREFMAKIAIPAGHTKPSTSQRDRYLDVRQHVVITAVCLDDSGREVATYDSLGGKSGGETQELVAFIVGAALRYQLGDETRSQPRFAPVFLDEGFVKSDSEFAGRSVVAWQQLGFQLIIGAPLDKVTALEPYMDLLLTVTKSPEGYSFISALVDSDDTGGAA